MVKNTFKKLILKNSSLKIFKDPQNLKNLPINI